MTYTIWSHGELMGESELDYVRVFPLLRTGDLHVTPKGLIAFERLSQTHADGYYAVRRLNRSKSQGSEEAADEKTLQADLAAEYDQYDALELELRAPNGAVVPTESIYVTDTEYLLAIGREADEEDEFSTEGLPEDALDPDELDELHDMVEAWEEDHPPWAQSGPEREPVRFQISVTLKEQWSIP